MRSFRNDHERIDIVTLNHSNVSFVPDSLSILERIQEEMQGIRSSCVAPRFISAITLMALWIATTGVQRSQGRLCCLMETLPGSGLTERIPVVPHSQRDCSPRCGFKYITALTDAQVRRLLREKVLQLDLFDTKVCEVEQGNLRLILRRNDAVRGKEAKRREDKVERLKELVARRNAFVLTSRRADPQAGLRTLTKWSVRHKVSSFVDLGLDHDRIVLTVDEHAKSDAALLDGCYVLETDVSGRQMDSRTVDQRYRSLQQVERDFRTLKNGFLEIRPVFVRKRTRTAAHVFTAMLALKIVRAADKLLKQASAANQGLPHGLNLKDALRIMSRLCFNCHRLKDIEVLRLPRLDHRQLGVCTALQINPPSHSLSARLSAVAKSG